MTDAIGIEVGRHVVRAVRIDPRRPDDVVGSEFTMDPADDGSIRDALVRTYGVVSARGTAPPIRLALTPHRWLIQTVDVTGRDRDEVLRVATEVAGRGAADATTVVDDGVRRLMMLLRWDHTAGDRMRSLAAQSGFADATVEPAAIALGRVLPAGRHVVWRDVEEAVGWSAVFDDGVPVLGASLGPATTDSPSLVGHIAPGRHADVDDTLDPDELVEALLGIADRPLSGDTERPLRLPMGNRLEVERSRLPDYPAHDLRSPARIAVAVGAALGAAGATGRRRTVEPIAPIHVRTVGSRLPWAVEHLPNERLDDHAPTDEPAAVSIDDPAATASETDPLRRRDRRRGSRRRYRRRR